MRIFIAEDEMIFQMFMKRLLANMGHTVVGFSACADEAVSMITSLQPDLVIMDINLCGSLDGIDAAEILGRECCVPVIFLTGYDNEEVRQRAMKTNPVGYLTKPFSIEMLERMLVKIDNDKSEQNTGTVAGLRCISVL
jgi:CheY-like chemotaxis protein